MKTLTIAVMALILTACADHLPELKYADGSARIPINPKSIALVQSPVRSVSNDVPAPVASAPQVATITAKSTNSITSVSPSSADKSQSLTLETAVSGASVTSPALTKEPPLKLDALVDVNSTKKVNPADIVHPEQNTPAMTPSIVQIPPIPKNLAVDEIKPHKKLGCRNTNAMETKIGWGDIDYSIQKFTTKN